MEYIADLGTRNIICGTIRQAIRDWKSSYYVLNKGPTEEECREILEKEPNNKDIKDRLCQINRAEHYKADTEKFFKSEWFKELKEASGVLLPKDMLSALYAKVEQEKTEKEKKRHEREISKERRRLDSREIDEPEVQEGDNRGERTETHDTPLSDSNREEVLCRAEES